MCVQSEVCNAAFINVFFITTVCAYIACADTDIVHPLCSFMNLDIARTRVI